MQRKRKYAEVDEKHCVGCGCCIKVCPRGAVSVPRGVYAEIDLDKCVGCGLCAKECPASVIQIIKTENREVIINETEKAMV